MMAPPPPLLPDVGVLGLPYHRFGLRWATAHHVLTRLAAYFRVVWLEPTHHWREMASVRTRRAELAKLSSTFPPNFSVYLPEPWLPDFHKPDGMRRAVNGVRIRRAWRQLRRSGCTTTALYLWHHRFESALGVGGSNLSLYHIDDEYSFAVDPGPMDPEERRVIRDVDEVFVVSPALMERKGGINPRMTFIPQCVDHALYSTPVPEPADIASIPHPRIGYTGILKEQLDWPLLRALVTRHPEWSFVFVGPDALRSSASREIVEHLSRMPNVHFLGAKTVWELASYPQHFDVCLMPYAITGYTNNINPLKLHEYLASGTPAVGARIRSLLDFANVIALPSSAEEWSAAVAHALLPEATSPRARRARQAIAREHDWGASVHRIASTICERLGPSFVDRLHHAGVVEEGINAAPADRQIPAAD